MTPDTHTFWDPEKGRYVTLGRCPKPQGSGVPTPAPTDDEQTAHKAVVAVDAVVNKAWSGFVSGFCNALLFVLFVFGVFSAVPDPNIAGSIILCAVAGWVAWRLFKAFWSGFKSPVATRAAPQRTKRGLWRWLFDG